MAGRGAQVLPRRYRFHNQMSQSQQQPPPPTTICDQLSSLLLRSGLAFVFSYAAMTALIHPATMAKYLPPPLSNSPATVLPFLAAYEVLLAIWLLSGRKTYFAALVAAL